MKPERFKKTKSVMVSSAIALVVAAATFGLSSVVIGRSAPQHLEISLTSGGCPPVAPNFCITSTISSSSTSEVPATLVPGAQRYLWYHVDNPLLNPITVTSLSIMSVVPPSGCDVSNLNYGSTTFSGSLVVGPKVGSTDGTGSVEEPISLYNLPAAQNNPSSSTKNCANQTFNFTYTGSAQYLYSTATALTTSPDPSVLGNVVTLTATVTKTSGTGTPTGTVTFHLGNPTGSVVGTTATLNTSGVATTTSSSLPAGSDNLYAVYSGDTDFSGSTSPVRVQTVVALPTACTGSYPNFFYGNPAVPLINGTNQGDFIYALGASYVINGNQGNDCLVAGDGNNVISDGNGNDVVIAGNGTNTITVGNGTDNVSVGNGSGNVVVLGNGADTVTVTSPTTALTNTHDTITGGQGGETIFLGSGSHNTFAGGKGKNTCHLPTPPSTWHGTVAAYYNDTITNCTVVTP